MKIKEFYEKEAEREELWAGQREKVLAEQIIRHIPKKAKKILDIGCGNGFFINSIQKLFKKNTFGMDLSHKRLVSATNKTGLSVFLEGDINNLPIKSNSIDTIVISEALEHIPEYKEALKEAISCAGKYIIITVPNEQSLAEVKCPKCGFSHFLDGHINSFKKGDLMNYLKNVSEVKFIKFSFFQTIYTYNSLTWKLPKAIRILLDSLCYPMSKFITFLKPNYILIILEK